MLMGLVSVAGAAERGSASYRISLDVIVAGGGESQSASFRQPENAIGAAVVSGVTSSASYAQHTGSIQPWVVPNAVTNWELFE